MSGIHNPIARPVFMGVHGSATWTNMPSAVTFFNGAVVNAVLRPMDLRGYTQVRYMTSVGSVAGSTGSKVYLRYLTTYDATASNYLQLGSSEVQCAITSTNSAVDSGWIDLVAGAKAATVYIVPLGSGGDGAADPVIGQGTVMFR